jgi:preprotein translocase subunit SecB
MDLEMKNLKEGVYSKDIKIHVKKKDMENINFLIKINKRFMGK